MIKKMEKVEIESDDKLFSLGVFAKHDSFLRFEKEQEQAYYPEFYTPLLANI